MLKFNRHKNQTAYRVYVKYRPCKETDDVNESHILGWYCTCKVGARIVGSCSHVACVIYYLSIGMHQETLPNPAANIESIFEYTVIESSQATTTVSTQPTTSGKRSKKHREESNESIDELNSSMSQLGSQPDEESKKKPKNKRSRQK